MSTMANGAGHAFIVGHRKSGSTWLLNLLSLHPEIRGVMETNLFHLAWAEPDAGRRTDQLFSRTPWSEGGLRNLARYRLSRLLAPLLGRYKPALSLGSEDRPATLPDLGLVDLLGLRRELRGVAAPEEYVQHFFRSLADRLRPRRYLLEKSPRNINLVDRIQQLFPGAPLIVIYRDGRDVVTSDRFMDRSYGAKPFEFGAAVHDWRNDMEAQLRFAEKYPIFACTYERLLADGAAVATELFGFLGVDGDRRLVDDLVERSSFRFYAGRERGQEDRRRFYRKGVVGDWKNHFSEDDKRRFKEIAGDALVELGYERDSSW